MIDEKWALPWTRSVDLPVIDTGNKGSQRAYPLVLYFGTVKDRRDFARFVRRMGKAFWNEPPDDGK